MAITYWNGRFCSTSINEIPRPPEATRKKSKFGNEPVTIDGHTFPSTKEGNRYQELKLMQRAGVIKSLKIQVPYQLLPPQRDESGKLIENGVKYIADFVYKKNGKLIVEDAKGYRTPEYKIKKKMMLFFWDIRIKEV